MTSAAGPGLVWGAVYCAEANGTTETSSNTANKAMKALTDNNSFFIHIEKISSVLYLFPEKEFRLAFDTASLPACMDVKKFIELFGEEDIRTWV
ncbi:MAG: hypothetical protein NZ921_04975 [Candidatus Caldarchaeum sp.]|nr:hypothetical protein [Candidatus Caldarchaeum sp.]